MGRRLNPNPSYLRHRQSGRARMVVYDAAGDRREIRLPGPFDSAESLAEYHRVCALLRAHGGRLPPQGGPQGRAVDLTVSELVLRFMDAHAGYYVHPGTKEPTSEMECLALAFRPLNRLYGPLPVGEFDSLKLEALQGAMASGAWLNDAERKAKVDQKRPLGAARSTINRHTDRVKRLFRWGNSKKLVPDNTVVNLDTVKGLQPGRSEARETAPVLPADPVIVEKTLPHLPPVPADLVRLLLLTGARVGELLKLRGRDLDRAGPVWLYAPRGHKTAHFGHSRTITFGPRAQLILRKYLKDDPDAYLFCPAEQDRLRKAALRAKRQTPVQPSQRDRSRPKAARKPGQTYGPKVINHAIRRACEKAGVPLWHTHMLRHTASLLIMREHGVEAARSVLGHKTLNMTLHYSGVDLERAKEVAAKIG